MSHNLFRQQATNTARIKRKIRKLCRELLASRSQQGFKTQMKVQTMIQTSDSKMVSQPLFGLQRFCRLSTLVIGSMLAVLLLSGCQNSDRGRLVGVWEMAKPDKLAKRVSSTDNAPQTDEVIDALPMMSLHFKNSGVLETTTKLGKIDSRKTGTWKVVARAAEAPEKITEIQCSIDEIVSQHDVRWIDDSTIRIAPPNMSGQKMILKFTRSD